MFKRKILFLSIIIALLLVLNSCKGKTNLSSFEEAKIRFADEGYTLIDYSNFSQISEIYDGNPEFRVGVIRDNDGNKFCVILFPSENIPNGAKSMVENVVGDKYKARLAGRWVYAGASKFIKIFER